MPLPKSAECWKWAGSNVYKASHTSSSNSSSNPASTASLSSFHSLSIHKNYFTIFIIFPFLFSTCVSFILLLP
ncbi:hypothetical protein BDV37DRAFT_245070 [Aspergillus pseudonomiae]|uniref:Uncharacterized protein n=1 Tax=Aspergillus pseudonomiae TaxID=1506151 RepID=A0A5N7DG87_9EURO|nr:uncharacterized protein BDV37DRAFT_245070 [Aspergillus pseudonomiae]KAE8405456.1 hypothetical protein BDV37DRAFT_245070 [Aspergillus pseudonomiae]